MAPTNPNFSLTAIEHDVSLDRDWMLDSDCNAGISETSTPRSSNALVILKLSGSNALACASATPPIADNPPSKIQGCMVKNPMVRNKHNKNRQSRRGKRFGRRKREMEKEWPLLNHQLADRIGSKSDPMSSWNLLRWRVLNALLRGERTNTPASNPLL